MLGVMSVVMGYLGFGFVGSNGIVGRGLLWNGLGFSDGALAI